VIKLIIKLKYLGIPIPSLSREAQQHELSDDATIEQLLSLIGDRIGTRDSELLKFAVFMVNKVKAERHTTLHDGDEVSIMYVFGGG
jgi:molybdopterin converting factor small subunit